MEQQLVSIVIPARNSSKTIEHCINSVQEQSYRNTETIIVDSKSTDDTASISERMGCRVIFTKWKTLGARYIGFLASAGKFILMLDSDQILEKSAIERCVRFLQERKYDMLCLEEIAYRSKTFIEKLYQADRRLVHHEFDIQKHPLYGSLQARFYTREILKNAYKNIPETLYPFVLLPEDSILYYEAWKHSTNVGMIPNAIYHIEIKSFNEFWDKNVRYGKSAKDLLESGYYTELLQKEIRIRKTGSKRLSQDKILSLLLLLLKALPYYRGFYSGIRVKQRQLI
jgi:glycosyltransferase involved in cell wall biosynthesis